LSVTGQADLENTVKCKLTRILLSSTIILSPWRWLYRVDFCRAER